MSAKGTRGRSATTPASPRRDDPRDRQTSPPRGKWAPPVGRDRAGGTGIETSPHTGEYGVRQYSEDTRVACTRPDPPDVRSTRRLALRVHDRHVPPTEVRRRGSDLGSRFGCDKTGTHKTRSGPASRDPVYLPPLTHGPGPSHWLELDTRRNRTFSSSF